MALLPIYNCYHPILREKTKNVDNINDEIKKFYDDMLETMYNASGVGLAANQVGDSRSIILIDEEAGDEDKSKWNPIFMINPVITAYSEDSEKAQEGCLSIPKFYEDVSRSIEIELTYIDINGKEKKILAKDFFARVIQHEVDHLNGILFFDRLSPFVRAMSKTKLKKVQSANVKTFYDMILPDGSFQKAQEEKNDKN